MMFHHKQLKEYITDRFIRGINEILLDIED